MYLYLVVVMPKIGSNQHNLMVLLLESGPWSYFNLVYTERTIPIVGVRVAVVM